MPTKEPPTFLNIPAELRLRIFSFVQPDTDQKIFLSRKKLQRFPHPMDEARETPSVWIPRRITSLRYVNRQLYLEFQPLTTRTVYTNSNIIPVEVFDVVKPDTINNLYLGVNGWNTRTRHRNWHSYNTKAAQAEAAYQTAVEELGMPIQEMLEKMPNLEYLCFRVKTSFSDREDREMRNCVMRRMIEDMLKVRKDFVEDELEVERNEQLVYSMVKGQKSED